MRTDAPPGRVLLGKAIWRAECVDDAEQVRLRLSAVVTTPDLPEAELGIDFVRKENEYLVSGIALSLGRSEGVRPLEELPELRRRGAKTGRSITGTLSRQQGRLVIGPGTSSLWAFATTAIMDESQWIDFGLRIGGKDHILTVELPARQRQGSSLGQSVQ